MKTATIIFTAFCLMVGLAGTVRADSADMMPFLTEFASDVPDVVQQVQDNRLIALRYAKHFHTEPSAVLAYFRGELSLIQLKEDTTLQVYSLDKARRIVSEIRYFKAGTKVFASRAGVPILEYGTGNPLISALVTGAYLPPMEGVATPVEGRVAGMVQTTGEPAAVLIGGGAPAGSSGSSLSGWLVPLGVAGAAAALSGGGGSSASGAEINEPRPIPEPAGLITMGSGLLLLSGAVYRRRKH